MLATVTGTVWNDLNGNGSIERGESALGGWGVYWDANANGIPERTEATDITDASGHYALTVPTTLFGTTTAVIREAVPPGWRPTVPRNGTQVLRISFGTANVPGVDFGNAEDVAAPGNLVAFPRSNGIHLAFTDNSTNETSFVIERRLDADPDSAFAEVARITSSTGPGTGTRVFATDATAPAGPAYAYRVRGATALATYDPSNVVTVLAGSPGGTGVRATYYNEEFFTGPSITLDTPVDADEDFVGGSPDPRIDPDTFSGTFSGVLLAQVSGPYTFYTASDDGIDMELIDPDSAAVLLQGPPNGINNLRGMPSTGFQDTIGTATLEGGKKYIIHWRFSEAGGGAGYRLGWSSPDTPQEVLPTELLFPAPLTPRDVQAYALCNEKVIITFTDVSTTETGVEVQRAADPEGPFTTIATLPPATGGTQRFADVASATNPLTVGQTLYYRLRAVGFDSSPFTQPVKVTVEDGNTRLLLTGNAAYLPGADNDVQTPADNILRLTDNLAFQNSGAFTTAGWDLEKPGQGTGGAGFNTRFVFRIPSHSAPPADGFTFVLQSESPASLGQPGSGMGYQGMPNSLAIKFDPFRLSDFAQFNQTGLYAGGAMDDNGINLPFDLTDGSTYQVDLTYDAAAKALTEKITNLSMPTAPAFQTTYTTATTPAGPAPLDLAQMLGGHCAFVGFTGATGGATAVQLITAFSIDGQDVPLTAVPPSPKVTRVWVSSTGWTQAFRQKLAGTGPVDPYGYAIPASDPAQVLPWANVNQISMAFDEDVQVDLSDLKVTGVAVPNYQLRSFNYDAGTRVGTWTLSRTVRGDRLTLQLNADAPEGVKNVAEGVFLDGEWAPGGDTFPSGNGVPGGDFNFGINVLAGDVNGRGKVDATSLLQVRRRMSIAKASASLYSTFFDVNGDGAINALDLAWVLRQQSQSLPAVQ